jgi:hypothetical protein
MSRPKAAIEAAGPGPCITVPDDFVGEVVDLLAEMLVADMDFNASAIDATPSGYVHTARKCAS